jgi:hypothetical protein
MKRTGLIGGVLVGSVSVLVISRVSHAGPGRAASIEAHHAGDGGLPHFQLDPAFPKVPSKSLRGILSDVAVDG